MHDRRWSGSEKKVARRAYDMALEAALARIMTEFQVKAAAAATPSDMWDVEDWLRQRRREIDELFEYRYSALTLVFGRLIAEGLLDEDQLTGLDEEKLAEIRRDVAYVRRS
jgi:Photoprotection regulator fluorescence recovery protein